jgi:phosphatidylglycerophosphate synthase
MAVLLFLLAGLMDALDGALARYRDMVTSWGAFYDSFIDRTVEIIFIFGLLISALISSIPAYLYIVTSILISYSRARAEGLGISLSGIGIMERAERIIILSLFIVLYIFVPFNLDLIIYILVLINSITIIQRIYKVYTKSRSRYD